MGYCQQKINELSNVRITALSGKPATVAATVKATAPKKYAEASVMSDTEKKKC
jgi:hypothetical protein